MPTYRYVCKCGEDIETEHSITKDPEIICKKCGKIMTRGFIKNNSGFILRGEGWAGKTLRVKEQMRQRRKVAGKKMVKTHNIPSISPNYKGDVCKSWDDARKLAKADGVNMVEYDRKVKNLETQNHKRKEKIANIARGEDG